MGHIIVDAETMDFEAVRIKEEPYALV